MTLFRHFYDVLSLLLRHLIIAILRWCSSLLLTLMFRLMLMLSGLRRCFTPPSTFFSWWCFSRWSPIRSRLRVRCCRSYYAFFAFVASTFTPPLPRHALHAAIFSLLLSRYASHADYYVIGDLRFDAATPFATMLPCLCEALLPAPPRQCAAAEVLMAITRADVAMCWCSILLLYAADTLLFTPLLRYFDVSPYFITFFDDYYMPLFFMLLALFFAIFIIFIVFLFAW